MKTHNLLSRQYIAAILVLAMAMYWWLTVRNNSNKGLMQDTAEIDPNSTDSFIDANGKPKNSEQLSKELTRFHIPAEGSVPIPAEKTVLPKLVEPPNPATNPTAPLNPGGVNGQRPPRK